MSARTGVSIHERGSVRVIVNADDLGHSEQVNDAVFAAIEENCVTSATLMANGPGFPNAVKLAKRYRYCSFGVHLNITEFSPLTSQQWPSLLVDPCGQFTCMWRTKGVPLRRELLAAIYREFCAQIERTRSSLGEISHLDSHHHVHTMPVLFPIVVAVANKYRVRKIRISRNLFSPKEIKSPILVLKKKAWNFSVRRLFCFATTDYFTDLATFAGSGCLTNGTVEIMVHPGNRLFAQENALLSVEWWGGTSNKLSFMNYRTL